MELYNVPKNSRIRVLGEVKMPPSSPPINIGDELNFHRIDGMYSYCTTDEGQVVHLVAWAEVEILDR